MKCHYEVVVRAQHDNENWHLDVELFDDRYDENTPAQVYNAMPSITMEPCAGCAVEMVLHNALEEWAEYMA